MFEKKLLEGIILYIFEPEQGDCYGNTITALINDDRAILIDTGYAYQSKAVMEDLNSNMLTIEKVIITHFHDDHMQGLKVLPDVPVYGSNYYQKTLDMWTIKEEHKYFTPTVLIEEPLTIKFGKHEIEMIPFPGHSICTIIVKINDEYIHIADELMFSKNGEPLLPCILKEDVKRQFISVNKLKGYSHYTFIPGHGDIITNKNRIKNEIDNVRLYLNSILRNSKEISFEEATKACSCTFLCKEWHENIYK